MDLTQERLKELLHYDHESGYFTWNTTTNGRAMADMVAGCVTRPGYIRIGIDKQLYFAHRLVWLYVYGYFPEWTVDHINRIRTDNRLINLREVSSQCQQRNCGDQSNNTSGIKGICWDKSRKKWLVQVTVNGKGYYIGHFTDKIEAVYHRYAVEQCLGFLDCDITSSALKFINTEHGRKL